MHRIMYFASRRGCREYRDYYGKHWEEDMTEVLTRLCGALGIRQKSIEEAVWPTMHCWRCDEVTDELWDKEQGLCSFCYHTMQGL